MSMSRNCGNPSRSKWNVSSLGVPLLMLLGLVLAFMLGANTVARPTVVVANRFVLIDEHGQERGFLGFRGGSFGLYLDSDSDKNPLAMLEVAQVDNSVIKYGNAGFRTDGLKCESHASAFSIGVRNNEFDQNIDITGLNHPTLSFVDRSGIPFVSLSHSEKNGVVFSIGSPLNIKDAHEEITGAIIGGKEADPRIKDAIRRSLRFQLMVPPFDKPSLSLWNNGEATWFVP